MAFPTFAQEAKRLCEHRPPETPEVGKNLDFVRAAFADLIEEIGPLLPEPTPDTSYAARSVHRACQDVIAAIVHGQ